MAESGFRLGIDFGTSNTVAVLRWPDGRSKALLFDGAPIMPSAVYTAEDGTILTGRDAVHSARLHPHRFEPYPKRRIDEEIVYLGDREIRSTELIATVLRRVAVEAGRVANTAPTHVTLTHPAAWGAQRRDALSRAAAAAGLPQPLLVPEPVAAASYFVGTIGAHLPIGGCAVVYDFGAGTFDATVVRRTAAGGFDVLATEGLTDAGGLDVDAAIVSYLGQQLAERAPNEWRRLSQPSDDTDRRAAWQLWEDARQAKETLSRAATTYVHVPLVDDSIPLGREQLEQLARPILDRTVTATLLSVAGAGQTPQQLAAVFLVGGSSRIPLAATLLHRGFGTAPMAIEQPELVVAEGALQLAPRSGRAVVGPPGPGGPGPGGPGAGGPGTGGPGSVSPAMAGPRPASPGPGGPGGPGMAGPGMAGAGMGGPAVGGPGTAGPGGPGGPGVAGSGYGGPGMSGPGVGGAGQGPGAYPERPVSATPMSGPPVSGVPMSGAPMSGAPMSGGPSSGGPSSGGPSSGGPGAPVSGSGGAPVSGPPVFGTPPQQATGPFPPQSSGPPPAATGGQSGTFTMPSGGPSGAGFGSQPSQSSGATYGTPQQSASSSFGAPPPGPGATYSAPAGQPVSGAGHVGSAGPVSGAGPMPASGSWPPVQPGQQGPMTGPQPPMAGAPRGPMPGGPPMSGPPMSGPPMSGPPMSGAHGVPMGSFGPQPGGPRRSRGPLVAAIAAGTVVLLLVIGGITFALTRPEPKPKPGPTVAAAACGYKIAYLGILSGDNSGDGQTVRNAAKLALDKYNGTHAGCTAELVEYDTKGDEDEAARMASELVRDEKVVGVVGPVWYSEAEKVMPIFDAAGLPVISPALMYSDLATKGWKTFHRTIGTDTDQASAAARYLTDTMKAQRVFIVSDKDQYASGVADEARLRLNTKFVGRADIAGDEKTFASVVSQVTASTADAVYFSGYHDAAGIFVKELRAAKPGIKIIGWDRIFTDLFVETATSAAAEGVVITCPCVPPSEARDNFANDYRSKYSEAGYYGPESFDAANVLLAALNAGKATRADVNTFIASYDGQGVSRQIKFASSGNLDAVVPTVWAYTVKDGTIYKDRVIS